MKVVLDPNILLALAHSKNLASVQFIAYLLENCGRKSRKVKIFSDDNKTIKSSYERFFEYQIGKENDSAIIEFLKHLLKYWETWTRKGQLTEEGRNFINQNAPTFSISNDEVFLSEHELLAFAHGDGRMLCISPSFQHEDFIPRTYFYSEVIMEDLRRNDLPNLKAFEASLARTELDSKHLSDLHERITENWIKGHGYNTDRNVNKKWIMENGGQGEIDVLADKPLQEDSSIQEYVVCECKLKLPTSSNQIVTLKDVNQVLKNRSAAKQYYNERHHGKLQVKARLISNVQDFEEKALRLALDSEQKLDCYHSIIPKSWFDNPDEEEKEMVKIGMEKLENKLKKLETKKMYEAKYGG